VSEGKDIWRTVLPVLRNTFPLAFRPLEGLGNHKATHLHTRIPPLTISTGRCLLFSGFSTALSGIEEMLKEAALGIGCSREEHDCNHR
jgi:hypothetical protein